MAFFSFPTLTWRRRYSRTTRAYRNIPFNCKPETIEQRVSETLTLCSCRNQRQNVCFEFLCHWKLLLKLRDVLKTVFLYVGRVFRGFQTDCRVSTKEDIQKPISLPREQDSQTCFMDVPIIVKKRQEPLDGDLGLFSVAFVESIEDQERDAVLFEGAFSQCLKTLPRPNVDVSLG